MSEREDGALSAAGEADLPARPTSAGELTGQLPAFVRDAVGLPVPVLDEDDIETVRALQELGVEEHDARRAVLERRVPLVLAQQVVGDTGRYTLEEVAERSGLDVPVLRRIRSSAGLPTAERLSDNDVRWAELVSGLLDVLPLDVVVRSARARGAALATIARSDVSMIRDELMLPMRQAGADDLTVSVALAEMARSLEPVSRELLEADYRLHLQAQLGSELVAVAARTNAQEVELSVGFVDVVGYTALSARIDPAGLDQVLDRFEQRIIEVISERSDVHVVKYLGDAVMLVAPDPIPLADAMLDLTAEIEFLADSPLRGGLAHGDVLVREGDYFGPPVNLAARLTDIARPWRVLAADELHEALTTVFDTRRILPTRIRGVGLRRPVAVRGRRDEDDEEE
ncbi:MAG: adenylate/guanylate cyclase domain-containing protein [Actinobacteria bacterium]|nr:adenylate/guanylate cyclase domain-containing protein [Actinomycetota bacterium]